MTPNPTSPNSTPAQSFPSPETPPLIPEVLEPKGNPSDRASDRPPASEMPPGWSEAKAKILQEIEAIARFMDGAFEIPLLGQSIGADALAGLLPIGGDLLTAIVSGYIVVRAKMMGVPKAKIWQMIGNIVIDTLLGSVPIAGDAFDVYWKANFRNIEIVRAHFGLDPFKL